MSVKNQIVKGVFYIGIAKYSSVAIQLIVTAILARVLTPSDFGIVAIALIIINFFSIFSELGLGVAIIQKNDLTPVDIAHIFSFTLWIGIILSVCFYYGSYWIAQYYENERLLDLCRPLTLMLLFSSINVVPNALLSKHKRFKFIGFRTIVLQIISGILAIIAVFHGWGIFALLINPIFCSISVFIINYVEYKIHIYIIPDRKSIHKVFSYSIYQFLFGIINFFSKNFDKILIGKLLGMFTLGFYEKSYRTMILPVQQVQSIITPVVHPVLAEYQNNPSHLSLYNQKILKLMAYLGFALSAWFLFSAREIILLLFGAQWEASIGIFQILALSVGMNFTTMLCGTFFQSANNTRALFVTGSINAVVNITSIWCSIWWFKSMESVAWTCVFCSVCNYMCYYLYMYKYVLPQKISNLLSPIFKPFGLFLLLGTVLYFTNLHIAHFSLVYALFVKSLVSVSVFLAYVHGFREYNVLNLAYIRKIKKSDR